MSNKTPYANLNQWVESDKPKMADFNQDNANIDAELSSLSSQLDNKVSIASPTEIPLSFSTGYQTPPTYGKSVYSIADNKLVVLIFTIVRTDGAVFVGGAYQLALLPVGARPSANINFSSVTSPASGISSGATVMTYVAADGRLVVHMPTSLANVVAIQGTVCYYAN